MTQLRPDQVPAVAALVKTKRGIVKAPAGAGKTVIGSAAVNDWLDDSHGFAALILANTIEQVAQWEAAAAGFNLRSKLGVLDIACYQSGKQAKNYDLVICDECHHIASPEFRKCMDGFDGVRWGLSATPDRADDLKDDVYELLGPIVYEVEREELVSTGKLAPAKVIFVTPNEPDEFETAIEEDAAKRAEAMEHAVNFTAIQMQNKSVSQVTSLLGKEARQAAILMAERYEFDEEVTVKRLRDYLVARTSPQIDADVAQIRQWLLAAARKELLSRARWHACLEHGIAQNAARNYAIVFHAHQHANDSVLILVGSIDHGKALQERIPGSMVLHSKMGAKKRREAMEAFRSGELKCAIATSLADEGLDVPRANVLILASAGRSAAKAEQRTGRVLRSWSDKTHGTIYDFWDWHHPLLLNQARARAKVYMGLNYEFVGAERCLPFVLKAIGVKIHPAIGMAPTRKKKKISGGSVENTPPLPVPAQVDEPPVSATAAASGEPGEMQIRLLHGGETRDARAGVATAEGAPAESRGGQEFSGDDTAVGNRSRTSAEAGTTSAVARQGSTAETPPIPARVVETPGSSAPATCLPAPVLADVTSRFVTDKSRNEARESTTGRSIETGGCRMTADSRGGQKLSNRIVHCKRDPYGVYIGRPSKWGNPYEIGKDGTRDEVIEKYRAWILTQPHLLAALPELKGYILGCWCAPQKCHGEVLLELVEKISEETGCINPADARSSATSMPHTSNLTPDEVKAGCINPEPAAPVLVHAERKHARLSPSTLKGKAICTGFISDPHGDKTASNRGSLGHEAVEKMEPELTLADEQLLAAVKKCIAYKEKVIGDKGFMQEIRLDYEDQWGFCDLLVFGGSEVDLVDWKFAFNFHPASGPQFQAYCVGIWDKWSHVETIRVHTVHPFLNAVDIETYARTEHYSQFVIDIRGIIAKANLNRPEDYRITDQCRYCGFAGKCAKLAQHGLEIGKKYAPDVEVPAGISFHGSEVTDPATMAALYTLSPIIKKAAEGWGKAALEMYDAGKDIPGFELRRKGGKRSVTSAAIAYRIIKEHFAPKMTEEQFLAHCDVTVTGLDQLVADASPKGKKGKNQELLKAHLEDEDALTVGAEGRFLAKIKEPILDTNE